MTKPRFFVPEVVMTSNMDCGPASLKSLLEGFGITASYGRLREACQTEVDGTSIDTLEQIAVQLGLDAEQVSIPADHVLARDPSSLPAIVVVRLPNGFTHFVVAWRRVGPFVQLMDPASGRRWVRLDRFLEDLHLHVASVPAAAFEEWVASDAFTGPLRERLRNLGCAAPGAKLLGGVEGWRDRAALDAAVRWLASIVRSGGIRAGREAAAILPFAYAEAREGGESVIPRTFWTGLPAPPDDDGEEMVNLRGAVLVRVRGRRAAPSEDVPAIGPELARALAEPPPTPWRTLVGHLAGDGAAGGALPGTAAARGEGSRRPSPRCRQSPRGLPAPSSPCRPTPTRCPASTR